MYNAPAPFITAMIGPSSRLYARLDLLDWNETLISRIESEIISGSVSVDKERDVRRQFNVEIDNSSGNYTWSIGGSIWIDKRIKFHIGLWTPTGITYVPLGVFLIEEMVATSKPDGTRVTTISGGDKWKLLDGQNLGCFLDTTVIKAKNDAGVATPVADAIKLIASAAGIPADQCVFESCSTVVPYDLNYTSGEARGKAIRELADLAVYDCYFDVDGKLRFKPKAADITQVAPCWVYDKSDATLYAGSEKVLDTSGLYNRVLVIGGSAQTATVSALASIDDPNSPISTTKGVRLFRYNGGSPNPLIITTQDAQNRADYELQQHSCIVEKHRFSCWQNYLHEAGDVIRIQDDWIGTDDVFELVRFNIDLSTSGLMTGEAQRIRKVV
ncbi:hypothetical protein [Tumebacillus permanentifrigoris]|uniref:Uncharacterized protein n=1 Tax=Tumebacillus permanentifrigoris TaxID=378543 RepID=A0A316D586_9BACL|nr:hypothetical protein [Tumebacillus permanentifrigoris]PWK05295.1 hypothetical protein C7459_12444 [Tumebacillus permanentifrigoris]